MINPVNYNPYKQLTGASAVSIQIFEPVVYNASSVPTDPNSIYYVPQNSIYLPNASKTNPNTGSNEESLGHNKEGVSNSGTTNVCAQHQLTPEAIKEIVAEAVNLAIAKVTEATTLKGMQATMPSQNSVSQSATQNMSPQSTDPQEDSSPEVKQNQSTLANDTVNIVAPRPEIMPDSVLANTTEGTLEIVNNTDTEASLDKKQNDTQNAEQESENNTATDNTFGINSPKSPEVTEKEPEHSPVQTIEKDKIIRGLNETDQHTLTSVIDSVAQLAQDKEEIALQLINDDIAQNLANIVSKKLDEFPGPSKERLEAEYKLKHGKQITNQERQILKIKSPKELAIENKIYAMRTLALLYKLERDELDKINMSQKEDSEHVPQKSIDDFIGFKEILDELATSNIQAVRVAAVQSLEYVARPEDKNVFKEVLSLYSNDKNKEVREIVRNINLKCSL